MGAKGQVLATDLDTRWMQSVSVAGLEVRRHDVLFDPIPIGPFDLIPAFGHKSEGKEKAFEKTVKGKAASDRLRTYQP